MPINVTLVGVADGRQNAARMIPTIASPQQTPSWQHELQQAFRKPAELLAYLDLPEQLPTLQTEQVRHFPLRVPRGYARSMKPGDPQDPLFLQVWPRPQEAETSDNFSPDAVGDLQRLRPGGLIHKYQGRALVVTTGACAVHCRYCFRQHFPYGDHQGSRQQWLPTLQQIASDSSLREVILSGGDPLSLTDGKLAGLIRGLADINHVKRLRLHTRQPVVLPSRVTPELIQLLRETHLQLVCVIHANHANELSTEVRAALAQLKAAGITLLNQSVLLRKVNDSSSALVDLSESLSDAGVMPYYLHLLDRVSGSAHFEVPLPQARAIMREIQAQLPGYLVPRLTREEAGKPAKTLVPW